MAKGGKLLAILGGILVLLGTFGLSLYYNGNYFYGIGFFLPFTNFTGLFAGNWVQIIVAVGLILYLLAFLLIFIGIKVRALAFIGSLFPLAMAVFVILAGFGLWTAPLDYINGMIVTPMTALVPMWVPLSFSTTIVSTIDLGTWVIALGGLLALISSFISREEF
jgi:hypothetical protein